MVNKLPILDNPDAETLEKYGYTIVFEDPETETKLRVSLVLTSDIKVRELILVSLQKLNEEIVKNEYLIPKFEEKYYHYSLTHYYEDGKDRPDFKYEQKIPCRPMEFYHKIFILEDKDM